VEGVVARCLHVIDPAFNAISFVRVDTGAGVASFGVGAGGVGAAVVERHVSAFIDVVAREAISLETRQTRASKAAVSVCAE